MDRFDKKTWTRFVNVAKMFFVSELRWKALGLLALLTILSITLVTGIGALRSYVGRDFITALTLKQKSDFLYNLYLLLGVFLIATPIQVGNRFLEERFGLLWREWLSKRFIEKYFKNREFYRVMGDLRIDNPDQRIAEDVRSFTTQSLSFFLIFLNSILTIVTFGGVLWRISFTLVIAVIACSFIGSFVTYFLGRPLIGLSFEQLRKEADFRYKLINVRDNAEAIAFYSGQKKESSRVRQKLMKAVVNLRGIIGWNRNLGFFTTWYNFVVPIVPTVIVAQLYLDGQIQFGVVTQANLAFMDVLNALSIVVIHFGGISAFAAVITRLGTFLEVMEEAEKRDIIDPSNDEIRTFDSRSGYFAGADKVTLFTPTKDRVIVKELSFMLAEGENLLVVGPSGSGKSSVLRMFAGLWSVGSGSISRPPLKTTLFIPQRPYAVLGTFRSQLLYPKRFQGVTDSEIAKVLKLSDLERTFERVGGFEANLDWTNILSSGEQQRIALARLLLSGAKYAFLDEATSALDKNSERRMYEILQSQIKGFISVGHREPLAPYHGYILELKGNGEWEFTKSHR